MICKRSITFTLPSKTGAPLATITVVEVNGTLQFDMALTNPTRSSDIRGLFFNLNDDAKMAGLHFAGDGGAITDFATGNVIDLGNGANMLGAASPFDVGFEFGTMGTKDIIQHTSFTLLNTAGNLTLDDIAHAMIGAKIDGSGGPGGWAKPTVVIPAAPDARDDSYSIFEDGQAGLDSPSKTSEGVVFQVLSNDTDADGDKLVITDVHGALHGTLTIVDGDDADTLAGDAILYTPDSDYAGTDSFEYCISDNHGGTDFAEVNVAIAAVADVPSVSYTVEAGAAVNQIIVNVTAMQNDADGSESIDRIELSGLPAGVTFSAGALTATGVPGEVTQQFIVTLPMDQDSSFDLGINAYAKEASNGDEEVGTATLPVCFEYNHNSFDQSFTATDQSMWSTGAQFQLDDDRFIGIDESWNETLGSGIELTTNGHIKAGFQSTLHFEGGEVDATVPYDITVDTNYNKTTDVLKIGGSAEVAPGASFTTEGPEGSYALAFIFDFAAHAGIVLDLEVDSWELLGLNATLGPINESIIDIDSDDLSYDFDLPAGFSLGIDWPQLDTASNPTSGTVATSSGASNNFLELGLDVDELVSAILGLPHSAVDIPFDVGIAKGVVELADIDVTGGLNFLQSFAMAVNDIAAVITFENGMSQVFDFASGLILDHASDYDTDHDGQVEFSLGLTPQATLHNDTDLGVNVGASFDILEVSGSYDVVVDSGNFHFGPVAHFDTSADVGTFDLYDKTFALNFQTGEIGILA